MLKWSKAWTGVEKKEDGTLVYSGRGALQILLKKNKIYIIDQFIYDKLKTIVTLEILIAIFLIIYIKSFSPLSYACIMLILILGIVLDTVTGFLKNKLVKQTLENYEKNNAKDKSDC